MGFLLDIFGYLTVVLHGLSITAEAAMIGGAIFNVAVTAPFAPAFADAGASIARRTCRWIAYAAMALVCIEALATAMQVSVLSDTVGLEWTRALDASFVGAVAVKIAAALLIAAISMYAGLRMRFPVLALGLVAAMASVTASHAAARLDDRALLMAYGFLHRLGADAWIGGLPYFLYALHRLNGRDELALLGRRYSLLSMASVATIALAGIGMAIPYVGSFAALYGTAYGVMLVTKIALFGCMLLLGLHNYRVVERLRLDPRVAILRLKRSVEVEIGIGITIFFCAASITSLPPAADLVADRATATEIVERMTPVWPRLVSPQHGDLAIPALQARLDAEAAAAKSSASPEAFVPGAGESPPRNAEDIAWSEYNHHWAGILVAIIGMVALLEHLGVRAARHWPLLFLLLAGFLLLRSDPEVWPLGQEGLLESLRDPEVVQHRVFVVLIVLFGVFEWRVRAGKWGSSRAALVFPLVTAVGAALLLTHQHAISNVKDQLLIELSHTPLAILGVIAGWTRWLEIRLDPAARRWPGYVWPVCFILIGGILIDYREA